MTQNEFIGLYLGRSLLPISRRTEDGYCIAGRHYHARPCACGDERCDGWAMVSEENLDDHKRIYAPGID